MSPELSNTVLEIHTGLVLKNCNHLNSNLLLALDISEETYNYFLNKIIESENKYNSKSEIVEKMSQEANSPKELFLIGYILGMLIQHS